MDPQVLLLAAVIAGRTSRIKIGSSVHRPVLKQPWETASARARPMNAMRLIICSWRILTGRGTGGHCRPGQPRSVHLRRRRGTRGSDARREHFFEFLEVMKQLWTEEHFSGFAGTLPRPRLLRTLLAIPKPHQKPYPPMLLPVDSQESFRPMGTRGYRIAIGAGSSPPNLRGSAVLKVIPTFK